MEHNFLDLVVFVYDFLCNTQFTAFNITLSFLDVVVGMFALNLIWYALYRIFD